MQRLQLTRMDYAAQCEAKLRIAEDALVRVGKLARRESVAASVACALRIRARARVAVKGGRVGYRRASSRGCVQCAAARSCPRRWRRSCAHSPPRRPRATASREIAADRTVRARTRWASPDEALELEVGGDRLRVSAGVFFQANPTLHEALVESVARAAGASAPRPAAGHRRDERLVQRRIGLEEHACRDTQPVAADRELERGPAPPTACARAPTSPAAISHSPSRAGGVARERASCASAGAQSTGQPLTAHSARLFARR